MVGTRSATCLIVAFLIVGCVPAASRSTASVPLVASHTADALHSATPRPPASATVEIEPPLSPSPAPSPTVGPLTVEQATHAFLILEQTLDLARGDASTTFCLWSDTSKPPPCDAEMDVGTEYWTAVGRAVGAYIDGLRATRFPDGAAAEAAAEIDDAATLLRRATSAADATSVDTFVTLAAAAQAASETESQTRQLLKNALGLPVGP